MGLHLPLLKSLLGAWIAEWYNTLLTTPECWALGREFEPQ